MLQFLASERSVFMFYFVGVDPGRIVNTVLVSMFQQRLLEATVLLKHWSGRNSRGVTQFEGQAISRLIERPEHGIDEGQARAFVILLARFWLPSDIVAFLPKGVPAWKPIRRKSEISC